MRGFRYIPTLILLVAALALGASIVWKIGEMVLEAPFEQRYPVGQIHCLAAALRADTIGEPVAVRGVAQDLVADAIMRYQASKPGVSLCEIFESGITLYPEKWDYPSTFTGRGVRAVRYSLRYVGSPWDDAEKRAREALKRGLDRTRCAIKYTRASRGWETFTNEAEAAARLLETMKRDREEPGIVGVFLCPAS